MTEMNQANVSWVPGFDGGYTQKFTVWSVKYNTVHGSQLSTTILTVLCFVFILAVLNCFFFQGQAGIQRET